MTNPNNIVRVRARNGGRASVYEANAWAQGFSMGILEGYGVTQNTSADMNVLVGGSATKPDVLIAQNPAGYKIALDIIGRQAVAITAPASNSRISAIVAYTNDLSLSTTQDDVTGSPASCGLIVVNGTAAANPVAPTDSQIRKAITSDGATGSQAAYCVIATIKVASNTTLITNSLISTNQAAIGAKNIDFATLTILTGSTKTITLPAGHWLVFAVANILTQKDGSFASTIKWLGITKNFQGYRSSGQNRNQSEFTFIAEVTVSEQTTYTGTSTGDACDFYQQNWMAIKLG